MSAEATVEEVKSATDSIKAASAEALDVKAGGGEGGGDDSGDDDSDDEPTPGATVEVLTDENFERITQVATGATTGDWFVGETVFRYFICTFF